MDAVAHNYVDSIMIFLFSGMWVFMNKSKRLNHRKFEFVVVVFVEKFSWEESVCCC